MKTADFTIDFLVDQSSEEVFNAVTNVRGWWSEMVEGGTQKLNDEFVYRHKTFHYSTQKLIEVVPNKRVVWLVTDSNLTFVEDKDEWTGTKISFEISTKDGKTKLRFTHYGMVPSMECFEDCTGPGGWLRYLNGSLLPLIIKGEGNPDRKEAQLDSMTFK